LSNLLTLLLLSLSTLAYGEELAIRRGTNKELILSGKSCANLVKQRTALCDWKKQDEPAFIAKKDPYTCTVSKGKATLPILNCLPTFAKTYHNLRLVKSGPNCWGTAMSFKKLSLKPRFMWPEEIEYWMDSPVCRKLDVDEAKAPGDIINVYGPEYLMKEELTEVDSGTRFRDSLFPGRFKAAKGDGYTGYHRLLHSITYVTKDLAFGKDSPSKDDMFYFHPMTEVYGRPRTDVECQENQSLEPYRREYDKQPKDIRDSKCAYFSTTHRCASLSQYFSDLNLNAEDQAIVNRILPLQEKQQKLFPLIISLSTVVSKSEVNQIIKMADAAIETSQTELKKPNLDKNREMLLTLEYFTAAGLKYSLFQAKLIPAAD
jgi:hypothetical protein